MIYLDIGDAQLRVHVKGNTEADAMLLILHGGPANDSSVLERGRAAAQLEDHFRVAYLDQRGMGGSWGKLHDEQLTLQQWADDGATVAHMLAALYEPEALWLYGHSWGGLLGTAMLLDTDAPEVVDGWIEVAGCHDGGVVVEESFAGFERRGPQEIAAGGEHAGDWRETLEAVRALPAPPLSLADYRELGGYNAKASKWLEAYNAKTEDYNFIAHLLFRGNESYTGWIPTAVRVGEGLVPYQHAVQTEIRLGEIEVPSLFIYGEQDFICPAGLGRRAHALVGSSRTEFVEMTLSGHLPMFDEPDRFAEAIIKFVEGGE